MKRVRPIAAAAMTAVMLTGLTPTISFAGPISSACLSSDRAAASRALCSCLQQAADITLSKRDQRKAAKMFSKPDLAQEVRMSSSRRDEEFWSKYVAFGDMATANCS